MDTLKKKILLHEIKEKTGQINLSGVKMHGSLKKVEIK